ncbi:MAG TPA: hypothetical protein PKD09_03310 [Aggregatilinea sp.]|uniref:spermine/spermidine synthase domain-containing protein n=1 Tax=Aggregatilinea sp. TaxID=2806333 RepID=UPI002B9EAE28|nr:hypothetical protein [Aggregatilinea sp.]HML20650.1 hypothetical protein [Aggregatilinea sp.]
MAKKQRSEPDVLFAGRAPGVLAVVMLLSAVGLAYEVALTRLFSLMFEYHYVFLIVSISVAGLGVGAALATLFLRQRDTPLDWSDLANGTLLIALLLVGTMAVLLTLSSASLKIVALTAAVLPFIGIGFVNSALFARFAEAGGTLYAADLLGGAVGIAAVLGLVTWLGAFVTLGALGVVCALAALILAWIGGARRLQTGAAGAAAVLAVLLALNAWGNWLAFSPADLDDTPPDKTMMTVLQDPDARLVETQWSPFARLDVVETSDEAVRYVFTDAGAGSIMVGYDGDDQDVAWLKNEIAYLPFTIAPEATQNVLILGSGAGKDVLMAHLTGAESITAVEINPQMIDLTRDYGSYNGDIYDLPGVRTVAMDGRNFVDRTGEQFDLIYANLVYSQAATPGTSALAENYVYTQEALHSYWDRLSDDGRIAFVAHHGIEGMRLVVGALQMLQDEGYSLQEALEHVALASLTYGDAQAKTSVVIVMRQPWSGDLVNQFVTAAHNRQTGVLYIPIYQETGFDALELGAMTLDEFIRDNQEEGYDYTPTTDNWPFFYQYQEGLPAQVSDLLFISLILAGAYLSWAIFFFVRRDGGQWKRAAITPYFALLGAAFLLVETPLIQRFNLLLGQPSSSLIVVIGALLAGGGLGSFLSSRLGLMRLPRFAPLAALGVAVLVALSLVIYPALIDAALPWSFGARVAVTVIALLPLGLLMGVPFPSGLRVASAADPRGVSAFWGANAILSVVGTALAMALAVKFGFAVTLLTGAVLYALAALLAYVTWPRVLAR